MNRIILWTAFIFLSTYSNAETKMLNPYYPDSIKSTSLKPSPKATEYQLQDSCDKSNRKLSFDTLSLADIKAGDTPNYFYAKKSDISCLSKNQVYEVIDFEAETGIQVATAKIESAEIANFTHIAKKLNLTQPDPFRCLKLKMAYYHDSDFSNSEFVLIKLKDIQWNDEHVLNYIKQNSLRGHLRIKRITPEQMKKQNYKDKYFVLDVRIENHYKLDHIPGAVNIPLYIGEKLMPLPQRMSTCSQRLAIVDTWQLSQLPKDKDQPIILYSGQPRDLLTERASYYLRLAGYTNIHWLWFGHNEWIDRPVLSPKKFRDLPIVNSAGIKKLKNPLPIDLRFHITYYDGHLPDALNVRYYHKSDIKYPEKFSMKMFKEAKDWIDLSLIPKSERDRPMVLYGFDDGDWRPMKAYLWMKEAGIKNVYWYREGYSEWMIMNRFDPEKYPILKTEIKDKDKK